VYQLASEDCITIDQASKGDGFYPVFIAKDRENLGRGCKFSLSFAMKRDKGGMKAIPFGSLLLILSFDK
jgi:hypothetical protein